MDGQPSRRGDMCLLQTAIIQSVTNIRWVFFVVGGFFFFFLIFLLYCSQKRFPWESGKVKQLTGRHLVNSLDDQLADPTRALSQAFFVRAVVKVVHKRARTRTHACTLAIDPPSRSLGD